MKTNRNRIEQKERAQNSSNAIEDRGEQELLKKLQTKKAKL